MTQPLHTLLEAVVAQGASDLHLSPGEMPWLRIEGEMERLPLQSGALSGEQIERLLEPAMTPEDLGRWKGGVTRSVNFAYAAPEIGRFRVNLASTLTGPAAVVRRIPHEVPTTEALGLPPAVCALAELRRARLRHRGVGRGKEQHVGRSAGPDQPLPRRPHPHRRGSDRVRARAQPVPDYPARGAEPHRVVHARAPGRAPAGPGRDRDRGGAHGGAVAAHPAGCGDGAPGDGIAAHHQRGERDLPDGGDGGHGAAGAGPRAAGRGAAWSRCAAPGSHRGRAAGRGLRGAGELRGDGREHRGGEHGGDPLRDRVTARRDADAGTVARRVGAAGPRDGDRGARARERREGAGAAPWERVGRQLVAVP
jgi:hypothetical protein